MSLLNKSIYDAEASVLLRAKDLAAITATTNGDAVAHTVTDQAVAAVIKVKSVDRTTTDETYDFTVQMDTDSGFGSAVTVATLPTVSEAGTYILLIDGETAKKFVADASYVRVVATLGGTTPICEYSAWLNPVY